jgi:hypothetical protein
MARAPPRVLHCGSGENAHTVGGLLARSAYRHLHLTDALDACMHAGARLHRALAFVPAYSGSPGYSV